MKDLLFLLAVVIVIGLVLDPIGTAKIAGETVHTFLEAVGK